MRKEKPRQKIKRVPKPKPSNADTTTASTTPLPLKPSPLIDTSLLSHVQPDIHTEHVHDTNAFIVTPHVKSKTAATSTVSPQPKPLSKTEQKKLAKLAATKRKRAIASAGYASLAATALTATEQRLLVSSGEMGKRVTERERIQRQFRAEKAGIRDDTAADSSVASRYRRWKGEEEKEVGSGVDGDGLREDEVKELLTRQHKRRRTVMESAPVVSGVVSSYGLAAGRWREAANAVGTINFDTHREITYGSDDDDEEGEAEDDNDDDDNEEKAEEKEDTEERKEGEEAEDARGGSAGLFSVAFDVIKTSNRAKRKRTIIINRGHAVNTALRQEVEQKENGGRWQPEDDESTMGDVHEWTGEENDEEADERESSDEETEGDTERKAGEQSVEGEDGHEQPEEEEHDDMSEHGEMDTAEADAEPSAEPLVSLRGKTRLVPASSLPQSISRSTSSVVGDGNGRFIRAPKPTLTPLPLQPGKQRYEVDDGEVRVSYNDERLGEEAAGVSEELDIRRKGEAILDRTEPTTADTTPHLYTRQLPSGKLVVYVNRHSELQHSRLSLPIASFEQDLIELLAVNNVVVVEGATGSGKTLVTHLSDKHRTLCVVLLQSFTGCAVLLLCVGKTTQVPQFLLENGYGFGDKRGMIGMTQPRRVAAVTTCQRVSEEMNLPLSTPTTPLFSPATTLSFIRRVDAEKVAKGLPVSPGEVVVHSPYDVVTHSIRYETTVKPSTRIKFMTDGVLLREMQSDFLLRSYSVIVIDEAHERGRNTDVLIGMLSRAVNMRRTQLADHPPLKLLIMSATLRTADFTANTRLFPSPPPSLSIPARQHPVVSHYARRTEQRHWLQAVLVRVMQMHVKLPEGGILVFVSGREEIDWLCRKVEEVWKDRDDRASRHEVKLLDDEDEEADGKSTASKAKEEVKTKTEEEEEAEVYELDDEADDMATDADGDEENEDQDADEALDGATSKHVANEHMEGDLNKLFSTRSSKSSASSSNIRPTLFPYCLPLYSLLPSHLQLRVFQPPPTPQHRTIIFATNIAETSITIPHIRYVLDSGRTKRREFDPLTGCERFTVGWISQASAQQREGRAGRTAAGHCYRMYSAAVYGRLAEQDEAEILREPVDSVVLLMKAIGVRDVRHFPFISPPPDAIIRRAELLLQRLGAVEKGGAVSELGRVLSLLPVAPRYGRMIALGHQGECLGYVIAIVAALTVQQLFIKVRMRDEVDREADKLDSDNDEYGEENDGKTEQREQRQQRRRQLHEKLTKATQRWQHKDSDLLTYLRVIGGYEFARRDGGSGSGSGEQQRERRRQKGQKFCDENFVRLKAMEEVEQLRAQLTQITLRMLHGKQAKGKAMAGAEEMRGDDVEEDEASHQPANTSSTNTSAVTLLLSSPLSPPTAHQERLLRHLLLSGMIDQVARRMTEQDKQALLASNAVEHDINLTGSYSVLSSTQPAFIHPSSVLFPSAAQPVYLVYQSLVESDRGGSDETAEESGSGKRYMRDCTVMEEDVMVSVGEAAGLVTWSTWLDDPPPIYNKQTERVEAFKRGTFGQHRWPIGPTRKPLAASSPADDTKGREYREFVRLLLQGDVLEQLRPFGPFYVCRPSHLSSGSGVKSGLMELVRVCARDGVRSRVELRARWKNDGSYLRREMLVWLQPSQHQQLIRTWPPGS